MGRAMQQGRRGGRGAGGGGRGRGGGKPGGRGGLAAKRGGVQKHHQPRGGPSFPPAHYNVPQFRGPQGYMFEAPGPLIPRPLPRPVPRGFDRDFERGYGRPFEGNLGLMGPRPLMQGRMGAGPALMDRGRMGPRGGLLPHPHHHSFPPHHDPHPHFRPMPMMRPSFPSSHLPLPPPPSGPPPYGAGMFPPRRFGGFGPTPLMPMASGRSPMNQRQKMNLIRRQSGRGGQRPEMRQTRGGKNRPVLVAPRGRAALRGGNKINARAQMLKKSAQYVKKRDEKRKAYREKMLAWRQLLFTHYFFMPKPEKREDDKTKINGQKEDKVSAVTEDSDVKEKEDSEAGTKENEGMEVSTDAEPPAVNGTADAEDAAEKETDAEKEADDDTEDAPSDAELTGNEAAAETDPEETTPVESKEEDSQAAPPTKKQTAKRGRGKRGKN